MLHVAIVEDEQSCALQLRSFLDRYSTEKDEKLDVNVFHDGMELVQDYHAIWDIIFLDIEMPRLNGMDTAKKVRELDQECVIIFVTNMAKYAIKGYEVDALDFVLKPVSYFPFSVKLDKAMACIKKRQSKDLLIQEDEGLRRIRSQEIYYVEVIRHRLHIHTSHGVYTSPGSLSEIEAQLAGESFARCNKGYLVNLRHISLVKGDVVVVGGDELLISRRKKKDFLLAVTDHYGGGGR